MESDHLGDYARERRPGRLLGNDHPLGRLIRVRVRLIALPLLAGSPCRQCARCSDSKQTASVSGSAIGWRTRPRPGPPARPYIVNRVAPGAPSAAESRSQRHPFDGESPCIRRRPASAVATSGSSPRHDAERALQVDIVEPRGVAARAGCRAVRDRDDRVPKEASAGERYAVIWTEVSAPAPSQGGVTLVNRVGVRMYVSIGSGGGLVELRHRPARAQSARRPAGRSSSQASHNRGGRGLDIRGTLTLSKGPGGLRAGPFPVELRGALAPGNSQPAGACGSTGTSRSALAGTPQSHERIHPPGGRRADLRSRRVPPPGSRRVPETCSSQSASSLPSCSLPAQAPPPPCVVDVSRPLPPVVFKPRARRRHLPRRCCRLPVGRRFREDLLGQLVECGAHLVEARRRLVPPRAAMPPVVLTHLEPPVPVALLVRLVVMCVVRPVQTRSRRAPRRTSTTRRRRGSPRGPRRRTRARRASTRTTPRA